MDPLTLGPLDWFTVPANNQGLVLALVAACCMAVVSLLYNSAGLLTVLLGVLMAVLLTAVVVPLAALYFHLLWAWWPVIGLFNGVASLRVMRGLDAFAARLEKTLPGRAAGRVETMVNPTAPPTTSETGAS